VEQQQSISELVRASTVASLPESVLLPVKYYRYSTNRIIRWADAGTISRIGRCSAMMQIEFESGDSWSVNYRGLVYNDARKIDGVWYYRDTTTKLILRFALQDRVIPLQKNLVSDDR
jgi:hypothetical protein